MTGKEALGVLRRCHAGAYNAMGIVDAVWIVGATRAADGSKWHPVTYWTHARRNWLEDDIQANREVTYPTLADVARMARVQADANRDLIAARVAGTTDQHTQETRS